MLLILFLFILLACGLGIAYGPLGFFSASLILGTLYFIYLLFEETSALIRASKKGKGAITAFFHLIETLGYSVMIISFLVFIYLLASSPTRPEISQYWPQLEAKLPLSIPVAGTFYVPEEFCNNLIYCALAGLFLAATGRAIGGKRKEHINFR